ncbi:MAG: thioredoxin domain-containing protein [Anaerolineales bacterium]
MKTNPGSKTGLSGERQNGFRKGLLISVAVLGLLIVGALVVFPRLNFEPAPTPTPTSPAPMDAAPTLGLKSAPVTIIEYGDFGCPSCWYWYKADVLNRLRAKYGDQIRFIWRDFPVITLLSPKAAEAGQCANEQGKFWQFHDAVYEHNGAIEASDLKSYATAIGLNISQFDECVTSRRYQDRVNAEQQEGFDHGINGTPFFLVNNQLLVGPQSLSVFTSLIDPLLASKK